jgi:glycosyltransferase involved in cell wall biosynthesis
MPGPEPLVSVIIPCYQQSHFLGEAIESALAQTYPRHEIIVVDDGSTDDTAVIVARYHGVRYIFQENQGTAAARNRGLHASRGSHLVFLDADDRLLPMAFETALNCLNAHPECAFVFGLCALIAGDGSTLSIQEPYQEDDSYRAMLRGCQIWHPATVMCKRSVFDFVTGFDTSLGGCSDYDFYLRVARKCAIYCHNYVVSEYRQHATNKSIHKARMLAQTMNILRSQRVYVKGNEQYEEAYRVGIRNFQEFYSRQSMRQVLTSLKQGANPKQAMRDILVLLKYSPRVLLSLVVRKLCRLARRVPIKLFRRDKK